MACHNLIEKWFFVVAQNKRRQHFKSTFFFSQLMRHPLIPLIELFCLSNLFQKPNNHRMVDAEFLGNFSCSCKRIDFNDCSQLAIVNFQWPADTLLIFRLQSPLQNFLNNYCTVLSLAVTQPNPLLILQVISADLQPILNSNKKIAQICFSSNMSQSK